MQVTEQIIEQAYKEKWTTTLSFYFWVKNQYKRSIIYDFTYRSAATKLGISTTKLRQHISKLTELGAIERRNGHIIFISQQKFIQKLCPGNQHLCTFTIEKDYSLKTVKTILFKKLIEQYNRQQVFICKVKHDTLHSNNLTTKRIKQLRKIKISTESVDRAIIHTCRNIAKKLDISPTNVSNKLVALEKMKLIKRHFVYDVVRRMSADEFKYTDYRLKPNQFFAGDSVIEFRGTTILLTSIKVCTKNKTQWNMSDLKNVINEVKRERNILK